MNNALDALYAHFFERDHFLHHFEKEVITFLDKDTYINLYEYSLTTIDNLILTVSLHPIEQQCSITLQNNGSHYAIIDLHIKNINHISLTQENTITIIKIFKQTDDQSPFQDRIALPVFLNLIIKPYVTLRLNL